MTTNSAISPNQFNTFGDLLKFLRRRAGLTQQELSIEVGYSESQISRLEKNQRVPDATAIAARFVPALDLDKEQAWVARLLALATPSPSERDTVRQPDDIPPDKLPPHKLPIQYTSFVGREQEIADLKRLLAPNSSTAQAVRLLTLTGVGGSGKTRLALRVATELLPKFPDGVFFTDLAPLTEATLVIPTIVQNLEVVPLPNQPALDALIEYLRTKQILLVLDNYEQVLENGPTLIELLTAVPGLKILVTSRAVLHVTLEREYRVPPLSVPNLDSTDLAELQHNESVSLFVERAQRARPDFQLTANTAPIIAEICVRLDGLPLAIELAAARVQVLTPQELLARLSRRFELLKGGARDLPARQQTLRNTIDWSYRLLTPTEQKLFARLGVFVGGWVLDAAEQVCNAGGDIPGDLIDNLQTLLDHNLIRQNPANEGSARFGMLETIREYALEQLETNGERKQLEQRHAEYFFGIADLALPKTWDGHSEDRWVVRIQEEKDNLRAALTWSQEMRGRAQMALRLVETSGYYSDFTEQMRLREDALAYANAEGEYDPHTWARVMYRLGAVKSWWGDFDGGEVCYSKSYELFQQTGDHLWAASSLERLGWIARERGDTTLARTRLEQALASAFELPPIYFLFVVRNTLAETLSMEGDFDAARRLLEENIDAERAREDWWNLGWTLNHLGHIAQMENDLDRATQLHAESLAFFREIEGDWGIVEEQHCLGEIALIQGDTPTARACLNESLSVAHASLLRHGVAWSLAGLAGVAVLDEEPERAVRLWGAAEHLRQRLGIREGPVTHDLHADLISRAREQLGEAAFTKAESEGSNLTTDEAVAFALQTEHHHTAPA